MTQTEVENDPEMYLQHGSIGTFYASLGAGNPSSKIRNEITLQLEAKGVYRERGLKHPRRVWWLAFVGEGGAKPRFDIREREHLFVEADPVDESAAQSPPQRQPLGATCIPTAAWDAVEDISADLPREERGQKNGVLQLR